MFKRVLVAVALLAAPAAAQDTAQPVNGGLVMHVAVNPDHSTRVSFGIFRADANGAATMVRRRELAGQCQWNVADDLQVQPSDVTPIAAPQSARTPEQFGVYVATLYSATASYRGGQPTPEQHGCVRELMTAMVADAVRRHQQTTPQPAPQQ
jgi:hypothetical protein